jgi:hypothetical protein
MSNMNDDTHYGHGFALNKHFDQPSFKRANYVVGCLLSRIIWDPEARRLENVGCTIFK